jgi:hypothetical protein
MPEDNSFEIARRLDEFGAGKGKGLRPARKTPEPEKPTKETRRRGARWRYWILALIICGIALWWWSSSYSPGRNSGPGQSTLRQNEVRSENPTQTIPAIEGDGQVPAFTVQVPSQTQKSSKPKHPTPAN